MLLVNPLTAVLTFLSLIGYAVLYTVWLKHATPQNIVIGGARRGATGARLGRGHRHVRSVRAAAVPHHLRLDAAAFLGAGHRAPRRIRQARAYRCCRSRTASISRACTSCSTRSLLVIVTLLPYLTGMSGLVYLAVAIVLDAKFLRHSIALWRPGSPAHLPMAVFRYSINFLMLLFAALLIDHYAMLRL